MSDQRPDPTIEPESGVGLRIGVVTSRFNEEITSELRTGALRVLQAAGVAEEDAIRCEVPGAWELPVAALRLARRDDVDAVICLGALVRGDTDHYDVLAHATAHALQRVALDTVTPVVFGVLTCGDHEQARARIGGAHGHKGEEAAATAIAMARLRPSDGRAGD